MKVPVLGAHGFIGRHIAFHLRDHGVEVLAQTRNPAPLADLTAPVTHDPAFRTPVVHLQIRIRDLAAEALNHGQALPPKARRLYRLWFALGWPAFAALVAVFWLMVTKPGLWQG